MCSELSHLLGVMYVSHIYVCMHVYMHKYIHIHTKHMYVYMHNTHVYLLKKRST
jgi:hypothetical protein